MNTFTKVLLSVPVLLTSVVSPALANDTRTVETTTGKTYTVRRQNVSCKTSDWKKSYLSGELYRSFHCRTAGVMTDLVGNRYHYNEHKTCAAQVQGQDWDWFNHLVVSEDSLTCGIVRAFQ